MNTNASVICAQEVTMYRRLNAFLAVLVVIVFTMLVIPALTFGYVF